MTSQYRITAHSNPGIYGQDAEGNAWATFAIANNTRRCHDCGKEIARGWMRCKHGEIIYLCSEHVVVEWEKEESRP